MKAIQTKYKGYRFRSRLEARWAVFFDALGIKWEYERDGYEIPSGRYLPDFFLHWRDRRRPYLAQFREVGYWVEIKGADPTDGEITALRELCQGSGHHGYLFAGPPGGCRAWVFDYRGRVTEWDEGGVLTPNSLFQCACVGCCIEIDVAGWREADEMVERAIHAARGARFEFGECGAAL